MKSVSSNSNIFIVNQIANYLIIFILFSVVLIIDSINKAVMEEDSETLMSLLKNPCLKVSTLLHKEEHQLYLRMLKRKVLHKESQNLWLDDIVNTINDVNAESLKVKELTDALVHLNLAVIKNDINKFWEALSSPVLSSSGAIESSCKDIYFQMFSKALKKRGHYICPWIVCHTNAGNTVYIDIESYTYRWTTPKDFVPYARYLTRKDVHVIIDKTNKHHVNKYKQVLIEKSIVKIQACCRGYLFRKLLSERYQFFEDNIRYIIKIQSWWRRIIMQKKYGTLIKMKAIEAKLKQERKQNPLIWYKVQVDSYLLNP